MHISKILITALLFISFAAAPVYALTQQDVDTLIRIGLIPPEKVAAARAAATGSSSSNRQTTTTTTTTSQTAAGSDNSGCLALSLNLLQGMSGSAVTSLQQFLIKNGHASFSQPTGYFGPATQAAIESFQKQKNIVLTGSPATTGFGMVGPRTRQLIKELTCVGGSGTGSASGGTNTATSKADFFGYNLDDLLNNYEVDFKYDFDSSYELDTSYDVDFSYELDSSYDVDFEYDIDFEYDFDNKYNPTFTYEPNFGSYGKAPIKVRFEVLATNGQYIAGGFEPVAVPSRDVTMRWTSENADKCRLTGDFPERNIEVPERGSAQVYLVNPSYALPVGRDGGKAMFGFRLTCEEDELYGDSGNGVLFLHIATTTTSGN